VPLPPSAAPAGHASQPAFGGRPEATGGSVSKRFTVDRHLGTVGVEGQHPSHIGGLNRRSLVTPCDAVMDLSVDVERPIRRLTLERTSGMERRRPQEIDLHVVHLVRDSRAVAYSWLRKKVRPEINSRTETMLIHSVGKSSFRWLWDNFLAHALRGFYKQYTRVCYEDFIDDPEGTILQICEKIGEPISSLDFLRGQMADLGATHTVAGNPNRFDLGSVQIKPDMEWVEKMRPRDKAVTVAITWPLLMYYGYFSRGQKVSECVKCTSS